MQSFLFPEDLDVRPAARPVIRAPAAAPAPVIRKQSTTVAPAKRPRPVPIILPPTYVYDAVDYKSKDDVVVSVARLDLPKRSPTALGLSPRSPGRMSMPERSPTLQKFAKDFREKKPSLTRWASATLGKQDKQERNARMALAEAERKAHAVARIDTALRSPRAMNLLTVSEEAVPIDYGCHHAVF